MIRINKFDLVPCIVLSIIIHSLVFFAIFYKNRKQNVFVQVPFEVSFYSPVQTKLPEKVEQVEHKEEIKEVKKEEIKPEVKNKKQNKKKKKTNKDNISVKNKEKKEKVKKETVEEKVVDNKQQSVEKQSVGISSNRGIMLENKNFKYSYYTNTIVKKISKYWQWSNVTSAYRAVVYFKISKDGTVYDIKIKESSSDVNFDQNAIRAVELASPFAPLPLSYEENYLGVYFEFKYY